MNEEENKEENQSDEYWWKKIPGSTDDWEIIFNCLKNIEKK